MNAWANMMKPIKTEKAEGVIFSFMEDLLLPFRASKGINKYSKKGKEILKEKELLNTENSYEGTKGMEETNDCEQITTGYICETLGGILYGVDERRKIQVKETEY